jgi:hypothetical protein
MMMSDVDGDEGLVVVVAVTVTVKKLAESERRGEDCKHRH